MLKDPREIFVVSFGDQIVKNSVKPKYVSLEISNEKPNIVSITFDSPIKQTELKSDLFTVSVTPIGSTAVSATFDDTLPIKINNNVIELKLKTPKIYSSETIKLSYVKGDAKNNIRGDDNVYEVDAFEDIVVTNNVAPRFISAVMDNQLIRTDNKIILLSYDADVKSLLLSKNRFSVEYKESTATDWVQANFASSNEIAILSTNKKTIRIILNDVIKSTQNVRFSYTKLDDNDANAQQNITGENGNGKLPTLLNQEITNNILPRVLEKTIRLNDLKSIYVEFDVSIVLPTNKATFTINRTPSGKDTVITDWTYEIPSAEPNVIKIKLGDAISDLLFNDFVQIRYTLGTNDNNIKRLLNKELQNFGLDTVENNLIDPVPILTSGTETDTANSIILLFDRELRVVLKRNLLLKLVIILLLLVQLI